MKQHAVELNRHPLLIRATHALTALSFFALAGTGALMYLHARVHGIKTIHEVLGLLLIAVGIVYLAGGVLSGRLNKLIFGPRDAAGVIQMALFYAKLRPEPPAYDEYNPLQKLAYTTVLLLIGPLLAATGLGAWEHVAFLRPLAHFFGGRADKVWHLSFAIELGLFFAGHMVMVFVTGLRANLQAILFGPARAQVESGAQLSRARSV
jgi:thiosulfate reductase cytochrome b subunit